MPWSRLRSQLESRFAPALKDSVRLYQARYRHAREEVGRIWLTVNGVEVATFATHMGVASDRPAIDALADELDIWGSPSRYAELASHVREQRHAAGEMSDTAALRDLEDFLSLSIEAALIARSPLVRALSVLDRRVGKRRLLAMAAVPDEHALVRALFAHRCAVEGLRLQPVAV